MTIPAGILPDRFTPATLRRSVLPMKRHAWRSGPGVRILAAGKCVPCAPTTKEGSALLRTHPLGLHPRPQQGRVAPAPLLSGRASPP